ncbi:MAG TPA: hypothetical protein VHQ90_09045 [Thermoanaerobaculia bacterium]|nr:hypothetical protein [Thermoanaerobaculia bacterium]
MATKRSILKPAKKGSGAPTAFRSAAKKASAARKTAAKNSTTPVGALERNVARLMPLEQRASDLREARRPLALSALPPALGKSVRLAVRAIEMDLVRSRGLDVGR